MRIAETFKVEEGVLAPEDEIIFGALWRKLRKQDEIDQKTGEAYHERVNALLRDTYTATGVAISYDIKLALSSNLPVWTPTKEWIAQFADPSTFWKWSRAYGLTIEEFKFFLQRSDLSELLSEKSPGKPPMLNRAWWFYHDDYPELIDAITKFAPAYVKDPGSIEALLGILNEVEDIFDISEATKVLCDLARPLLDLDGSIPDSWVGYVLRKKQEQE